MNSIAAYFYVYKIRIQKSLAYHYDVYGNILMSAKRAENRLDITLTVPQDCTAQVSVPQGYKSISCNGKTSSILTLSAGQYNIVAE
jgi:hypothetical protein